MIIVGTKRGTWTIIERVKKKDQRNNFFLCRCDCGVERIKRSYMIGKPCGVCVKKEEDKNLNDFMSENNILAVYRKMKEMKLD